MGWDRSGSRDRALEIAIEDEADQEPPARWRPAPGKRTRTTGLAAHGGARAPFPHRDAIERSFSRAAPGHARVGPAAAEACREESAAAFALDGEVAFASETPGLHTAAHEAAHVLQERVGVASGPADLEAHADEAAALAVRGQSAAHMFGGAVAPSGVVRRAPETARAPAADALPEAPVAQIVIRKGRIPRVPGMTVDAKLVIGGSPVAPGAQSDRGGGPGTEWQLDRLGKPRGQGGGALSRLASSMNTKLEAPGFTDGFAFEGGPDLKLELTPKLEAEGMTPGGVLEAEVTADITDFAVERGFLPSHPPVRVWLQVEVSIRVEPHDLATSALLHGARKAAIAGAEAIRQAEETLQDLEQRRAAVAKRRAALGRKADPKLWNELDAQHRALAEEIRETKAARGQARKRLSAAVRRSKDLAGKMKSKFLRTVAGQMVARLSKQLLKIVPLIGWVSWAMDAWEFGSAVWKMLTGDSEAGESADGAEGEKGAAPGGAVGDEEGSGSRGDGVEGGDVEGEGPDGGAPGGTADAGAGGVAHGIPPDGDGVDPTPLHEAARAVYDLVTARGGHAPEVDDIDDIDDIWIDALNVLVPRDLAPDKLDALLKTLRAVSVERPADPDELLAEVARALELLVQEPPAGSSSPPSGTDARRPERRPGPREKREQSGGVMTELPPGRLVAWKDGVVQPTDVVGQLAGLPFQLADGTVARIETVAVVVQERPTGSQIAPFRLVIELRRPDGSAATVVQEHAIEVPKHPDAEPTFFRNGTDEIRAQISAAVDHEAAGQVALKEGMMGKELQIAGATLRLLDVKPAPSDDSIESIAVPGLTISFVVVHMEVVSSEGSPALGDDTGKVHALVPEGKIEFGMTLTSVFSD